jgi:putative iron-regulated protein
VVRAVAVMAIAGLALTACGDDDKADDVATTTAVEATAKFDADLAKQVVDHYADGVYTSYTASLDEAKKMQTAIDAFVAAPTEDTLTAARAAWIEARKPYGETEAYRFYGGPIDNEEDGPEGLINGWPLDEQYIDYTETTPTSGIIADTTNFPEITKAALADANEKGGEANLSTGWHAIEFLLWGQDLSATGPGARPATDYTTAPNADRRATYLSQVTELLIDNLTTVTEAWAPDSDNYRATFVKQDATKSLTDMITGIGELSRGELAGERMNVAYEQRDQENEHSCFSDNTTADLLANATSISNVWNGTFTGAADGPGLADLVAKADEAASTEVTTDIAASIAEISKIPAPFDSNLTADAPDDGPGRTAIRTGIEDLGTQTDAIVAAGKTLGVEVEVS